MSAREEPRAGHRSASATTVAAGCFLVLSTLTLLGVIAAGDRIPLWSIVTCFLLALAVSIVVGAIVPAAPPRGARDGGAASRAAGHTASGDQRPLD